MIKLAYTLGKLAFKGIKAYKKSKNIKAFKNNPNKFKKLNQKDQTDAITADVNKFLLKEKNKKFNKGALIAIKKIIKDKSN
tara:strand:+ start:45 stop:287 length:243 start_codon:yes stop_codon:yes gene_type:complete